MFCTPILPEIDKDEIPQKLFNDKAMFCLISQVKLILTSHCGEVRSQRNHFNTAGPVRRWMLLLLLLHFWNKQFTDLLTISFEHDEKTIQDSVQQDATVVKATTASRFGEQCHISTMQWGYTWTKTSHSNKLGTTDHDIRWQTRQAMESYGITQAINGTGTKHEKSFK